MSADQTQPSGPDLTKGIDAALRYGAPVEL
jgi:hypothetical protein